MLSVPGKSWAKQSLLAAVDANLMGWDISPGVFDIVYQIVMANNPELSQ